MPADSSVTQQKETGSDRQFGAASPQLSLPKGGASIGGIGEKFSANPVTGTGSISVPIALSPGRAGFTPQLSLQYDSGAPNGPFGLGWTLALPSITRRTDKGLPKYEGATESDIFILSGSEDLVPALSQNASEAWERDTIQRDGYLVTRYRPRIEGLFARIERWSRVADGDTHWRSISKDNVTSLYGASSASRVTDPSDTSKIFSWLICSTTDDKGNAVVYDYVAEDSSNVDISQSSEANRTTATRSVNRYIKRVRYGNTPSCLTVTDLTKLSWLFELVLDYDEGYYDEQPADTDGRVFATASTSASQPWSVRPDPFSRYRSCFEVRNYRLCRRVLLFHHFASELGMADYLVRSTEFTYLPSPIATQLIGITQSGFARQSDGRYLRSSLPTLELEYSQAQVQQTIQEVDVESLENLPASVDGRQYRWLDLDGEGLQSVLAEQAGAWYYKRNLSPLSLMVDRGQGGPSVQFEAQTEISRIPAAADAEAPNAEFLDLTGDGHRDFVVLDRPGCGFYERAGCSGWRPLKPLVSAPNVDWNDPNLRLIDVDGDGFSDVLITEQEVFTYFPSWHRAGFGPPTRVAKATDEERGPAIIFGDKAQSIFLADMSGDGLADIVRIRNGEVCYWPNLGYGRFGPKISMDQSPWFDTPDLFDQRRIRLADIDGSGVADIIYLAPDGVQLYFNQSGNSWSGMQLVADFPPADSLSSIQVIDLLGNGTACLVWTTSLPGDARQSMRYINLMGGVKPYLLVRSVNKLGAETRVSYTPSTAFYLADRQAGMPWATRLPFVVQVVERVETYDWISRNRFVTRYCYHHGYFDGIEREFRGFGMVEKRDTEELGVLTQSGAFPDATNIDAASYVPPVITRTWFHTGAYPQGRRVSRIYESEYYEEQGLTQAEAAAMQLPDSFLPSDLTGEEIREAIRALKGSMLRQEVYALDGASAAGLPYSVSESNFTICRLQPFGGNRHAVFFTHARESVQFSYERMLYDVAGGTLADPRVSHSMTLVVDDYGNEVQSASIAYARRHDDPDPLLTSADRAIQRTAHATYTQRVYSNAILDPDAYRTLLRVESCTFELINTTPDSSIPDVTNLFAFDELASKIAQAADGLHDLPYEDIYATGATEAHPYRRPIERVRTLYRADDLSGGLPLGTVESLALPFASYKQVFTPGLLALFQRGAENLLPDPPSVLRDEGAYVLGDDQQALGLFPASDASGLWWIPSGRVYYSSGLLDAPATELTFAKAHFFTVRRYQDPFDNTTFAVLDAYDLLLISLTDAVQNIRTATNDYRVLQPSMLTDPNGNQSAVAFDALGMVVGTAIMGKPSQNLGDSLSTVPFLTDLTQTQIDAFFADPRGPQAAILLANATTRLVYDIGRYARQPASPLPTYAATIARETHASDLQAGASKLQVSVAYSDGLGRVIQTKSQAEPGSLVPDGPAVPSRWVGSGWTILNNKGKPVRKYEPFFDSTHDFAFGVAMGVSPTLFYDPVGRVVATLHPNHAWEKVVFDPWRQDTWDVNDTVLIADPTADPDVGPYFARIPASDYAPTWYAQNSTGTSEQQDAAKKAAVHANTPTTAQFDTLGRTFLTVAYNRFQIGSAPPVEAHYRTATEFDIEGNQRSITDAFGRKIMIYDYDMLGTRIRQQSVDAGERWMLNEVAGKPLIGWDSRDHCVTHEYDAIRRPTNLFVQSDSAATQLAEQAVYGEGQPNDQALNLRGQVFQQYDNAGVVTNTLYDFKDNLLNSSRRLREDYSDQVDWSLSPSPTLSPDIFVASTAFDALNRPIAVTSPDASVIKPSYNATRLLQQIAVNLRGAAATTQYVANIDYNAKGQREQIDYSNGASTSYTYDPNTFRLTDLVTTRSSDGTSLQSLSYTYDPAGNITHIDDQAQQTIYFSNQFVEPSADYVYDALYRLIQATGRELIGLVSQTTWDDSPRMGQPLPLPADVQALRGYKETYSYDPVGNILSLAHAAASNGATSGNWTRSYAYDEPNSPPTNNQLTSTTVGAAKETPYSYDPHGNMTAMPHLSFMAWDFKDQLQTTQRQVVNNGPAPQTYYVYNVAGQRVRKVNQTANGAKANERIYIGGYEVYREYNATSGAVSLEWDTLHVMDDKRRIALVETKTIDQSAPADALPSTAIRYQYANQLGSTCLELDETASVISYEEYYPYGSTSYQAGPNAAEVSLKRYRYTGKERDAENGFNYHGARYCAPWLGRWTSCDPKGLADGISLYVYARDNPIAYFDPAGTDATSESINPAPAKPALNQVERPQTYHWGGKIQSTPPPDRPVPPPPQPVSAPTSTGASQTQPATSSVRAASSASSTAEALVPRDNRIQPAPYNLNISTSQSPGVEVGVGRQGKEATLQIGAPASAKASPSLTVSSAFRFSPVEKWDFGVGLAGQWGSDPQTGATRGATFSATQHVKISDSLAVFNSFNITMTSPSGAPAPSENVIGALEGGPKTDKFGLNLVFNPSGAGSTGTGVNLNSSLLVGGSIYYAHQWNSPAPSLSDPINSFSAEAGGYWLQGTGPSPTGGSSGVTSARGYLGLSYTHTFLSEGVASSLVGVGVSGWHENTTLAPPNASPVVTKASFLNFTVGVAF